MTLHRGIVYGVDQLTRSLLKIPISGGTGIRLRCVAAPNEYRQAILKDGTTSGFTNETTLWSWTPDEWEPGKPPRLLPMPGMQFIMAAPKAPASEDPPRRRAREAYDQTSFIEDLDEVLAELKLGLRIEPATLQPSFKKSESFHQSLGKVALVLILRQMATPELVARAAGVLDAARAMLIAKNAAYGDSALNPVRVFSSASLAEQLLVRLDDKVSRIERGEAAGEDVVGDMLGYMILVLIAKKREGRT